MGRVPEYHCARVCVCKHACVCGDSLVLGTEHRPSIRLAGKNLCPLGLLPSPVWELFKKKKNLLESHQNVLASCISQCVELICAAGGSGGETLTDQEGREPTSLRGECVPCFLQNRRIQIPWDLFSERPPELPWVLTQFVVSKVFLPLRIHKENKENKTKFSFRKMLST